MTVTYYSLSVSSTGGVSLTPPSSGLVRKLISVLEAVERLPVFSHDSPGSSLNLQVQSLAVRELDEHGEETVCVERPASFAAGGLGRCVQLSYAEDKTPTSLNTFLTLSLTFCFYSHHLPPSLPPSTHSFPPSLFSGQVIQRRLHLKLERFPGETDLRDFTGRSLRLEPLVSVEGLEKFLNRLVRKGIGSK